MIKYWYGHHLRKFIPVISVLLYKAERKAERKIFKADLKYKYVTWEYMKRFNKKVKMFEVFTTPTIW